jgi:hypothetical protein
MRWRRREDLVGVYIGNNQINIVALTIFMAIHLSCFDAVRAFMVLELAVMKPMGGASQGGCIPHSLSYNYCRVVG